MSNQHAVVVSDHRNFPALSVAVAVFTFILMTLVPRLAAIAAPAILLSVVVVATTRLPQLNVLGGVPTFMALALAAFGGWILFRGPWPGAGFEAISSIFVLAFFVFLLITALNAAYCVQPVHSQIERAWFAVGLIIVALLVFVHLATNQAAARVVLDWFPILRSEGTRNTIVDGKVVSLNDSEVNRQAILLVLWMWPVWLMARTWKSTASGWLSTAILGTVAGTIAFGTSETAKLALFVGGLLFALYQWRPRFAFASAVVGWTSAIVLVVPLSIALHAAEMHKSEGLFFTARARVVVWREVALKIMDRPVFGHGGQAMRGNYFNGSSKSKQVDAETGLPLEAAHAHNIYLQVWYEFGAIGAILLGLVGYAALTTLCRLPGPLRGVGLAHFGVVSGVLATGYGLWQPWLQAAVAYSLFLLLRAGTYLQAEHTQAKVQQSHTQS